MTKGRLRDDVQQDTDNPDKNPNDPQDANDHRLPPQQTERPSWYFSEYSRILYLLEAYSF